MDPLSRLPLECLQRILHTIAANNPGSIATLTRLARVNRYLCMVTLPIIYRNPFKTYKRIRARILFRTLLASIIPVSSLHPSLLHEFKLDDATTTGPNSPRLDHLHDIFIEPNAFQECILQGHATVLVDEASSDIQGRLDRLPSTYVDPFQSKDDLLWRCHGAVVLRELSWAFANPVFEQLETLSIPLSDIHRYHQVVDRLPRLEQLVFLMDEIYDSSESDTPSTKTVREDMVMQELVRFVEEHTRTFKGRLKNIYGLDSLLWPQVRSKITESAQRQIVRLLPPLHKPTSISSSNWARLMEHPLTTDLSDVQNICGVKPEQWRHTIRENFQMLQRCRSLKSLDTLSIGRSSFAWAVQEKRRSLYMPGSRLVDSSGGGRGSQLPPATEPLDLVPLESVMMYGYHALTDEADDIAYAFSQTLRRLVVVGQDIQGPFPTVRFGRGWVNLPALTELVLRGQYHKLVIDPALLTCCPSLTRVRIADATLEYQCQDIEPCLPATLPHLYSVALQGWSALTFDSATLHSTPELNDLQIWPSAYSDYTPCFIPPLEELNRSYGVLKGGEETQAATPGPARPLWTWDWHLPNLRSLKLNGEFAILFEFQMLDGCPALESLHLNICEIHGEYNRVLSRADFFLPAIDTITFTSKQEGPSSARRRGKRRLGPVPIVVKHLKLLALHGRWMVDDTLLPQLLDGMAPKLNTVRMGESSGFSMRCLVDFVKTKVKHINCVHVGLPQPSEEECVELGLYPREGRKKDTKITFHHQLHFQGTEYFLLRDPSVAPARIT